MPYYIYLIHPLRHEFFEQPTDEEEAAMQAHFAYLKQATVAGSNAAGSNAAGSNAAGSNAAGTVLLAGPCLDDTFGLVVFQAEDDEAARAFMYNDPSVQANVMMAELHPFRLSLPTAPTAAHIPLPPAPAG